MINKSKKSVILVNDLIVFKTDVLLSDAFIWCLAVLPIFFSGPQLVVGAVVNTALFLAADNWTLKKQILLAIIPSLGAILHGVVLGGFTPFLVYLAPFIWLANIFLIFVYKLISKKSVGLGVGLAALIKVAFLFSSAWILVRANVLPSALLLSMGAIQLTTALLGGAGAQLINSLTDRAGER